MDNLAESVKDKEENFITGVKDEMLLCAAILILMILVLLTSHFLNLNFSNTLIFGITALALIHRIGRLFYKALVNIIYPDNFYKADAGRLCILLLTLILVIYMFVTSLDVKASTYINFMITFVFVAFISSGISLRRFNTVEERDQYLLSINESLVIPKRAFIIFFATYYVCCMAILGFIMHFILK